MKLFKTDLFSEDVTNLLPYDGVVDYYGKILTQSESQKYYHQLLQNPYWHHANLIMYEKLIVTKRKIAWFGDDKYTATHSTLPWTDELLALKKIVEELSLKKFNCCFLNLYHNGLEGIGWHSDDEEILGPNPTIASLSFGAERKFCFKHKINQKIISIILESGSLLIMKGATQRNWLHGLPKSKKIMTPRINLTFREIVN